MELSLVIAILALIIAIGGVALTWYVYRVAKKVNLRGHLMSKVIFNALLELGKQALDDEAMDRVLEPLLQTGYVALGSTASGHRYWRVSKKGEVILGTEGRTPIDITWE